VSVLYKLVVVQKLDFFYLTFHYIIGPFIADCVRHH